MWFIGQHIAVGGAVADVDPELTTDQGVPLGSRVSTDRDRDRRGELRADERDALESGARLDLVTFGPVRGLCDTCRHARQVETRRGSVYRLCERSVADQRFPRYPTLPVLRCDGFEPGAADREARARRPGSVAGSQH